MAEKVLCKDQAFDLGLDVLSVEQDPPDRAEQLRLAREETDRIVARRHRRCALGGDAPEAWPETV